MVTEDVGTYTLPGFVCDRKLCYLSLGRNKPFIIIIIIITVFADIKEGGGEEVASNMFDSKIYVSKD